MKYLAAFVTVTASAVLAAALQSRGAVPEGEVVVIDPEEMTTICKTAGCLMAEKAAYQGVLNDEPTCRLAAKDHAAVNDCRAFVQWAQLDPEL